MEKIQAQAQVRNDLLTWTVYDHPTDYPGHYVIRPYSAKLDAPLTVHFKHEQLDAVRAALANMGLTCLPRAEGDDPCIVEVWL